GAGPATERAGPVALESNGVARDLLVGADREVDGDVLRVRAGVGAVAAVAADGDEVVADLGAGESAGVVPAEHDGGLEVVDVQLLEDEVGVARRGAVGGEEEGVEGHVLEVAADVDVGVPGRAGDGDVVDAAGQHDAADV